MDEEDTGEMRVDGVAGVHSRRRDTIMKFNLPGRRVELDMRHRVRARAFEGSGGIG